MSRAKLMTAMMVVALLLAACQGNPEPPPLDGTPTSPSPSRTTSPTVAAPSLPPEAEGTSPTAAKAFVRHWIEVLNYAGPAGDAQALRRLSARQCAACSAIIQLIENVESHEGEISGDGWRLLQLKVVSSGGASGEVIIDATVDVEPQEIRPSINAEAETFPGGQRLKTFWVRPRNGSWVVTRLDQPS